MPRKAKEKIDEIIDDNEIIDKKSADSKKKTSVKKKTSTTKKTETELDSSASAKKATKKATSRKTDEKKVTKKSASNKTDEEKTTKKSSSKKTDEEKTAKKSASKKSSSIESSDIDKIEVKKTTSKSKKKSDVDILDTTKLGETVSAAAKVTKSAIEDKKTKKATKNTTDSKTAKKATKSTTDSKTTKKATKSTADSKTTKKATKRTTKSPAKKSTKSKSTEEITIEQPPIQIAEYYDLPLKYGNTMIKLLAQTPNTLFVYWEVSDEDIENFKKNFGDDFFNKTIPILIVHNLTLNKSYEVEINDFANCWYLNTEDSDCKFDVELGRKFISHSSSSNDTIETDYLYIATSNNLQSPNDHILFEKIKEFVVFRDVNNNNITKKNIKSFKFLKDLYKFYKDMYDEDILNNPSSQFKF